MNQLIVAVNQYDYPARLYDFRANKEISFANYTALHAYINKQLRSDDLAELKNGLSNVLYWGHYRAGYREIRVGKFKENITCNKLEQFCELVYTGHYSLIEIKNLEMPEFSGLAFVSKILMFLDPANYVILDSKIMELSDAQNASNPLTQITFTENDTSIRITKNSQEQYLRWCEICKKIAASMPDKIAVDIERGFFKLVEDHQLDYGKQIVNRFS